MNNTNIMIILLILWVFYYTITLDNKINLCNKKTDLYNLLVQMQIEMLTNMMGEHLEIIENIIENIKE